MKTKTSLQKPLFDTCMTPWKHDDGDCDNCKDCELCAIYRKDIDKEEGVLRHERVLNKERR